MVESALKHLKIVVRHRINQEAGGDPTITEQVKECVQLSLKHGVLANPLVDPNIHHPFIGRTVLLFPPSFPQRFVNCTRWARKPCPRAAGRGT